MEKMLKEGTILPYKSERAYPVVLAEKSGEYFRFCIDNCILNVVKMESRTRYLEWTSSYTTKETLESSAHLAQIGIIGKLKSKTTPCP